MGLREKFSFLVWFLGSFFLFASDSWTVGRALETFCKGAKVPLYNNDPSKPKLFIFALIPFDGSAERELVRLDFDAMMCDVPSGEEVWVEKEGEDN